jgi:hypothetical protein
VSHETTTLGDLARFITSKNAGPFLVTIDIVFPDDETYRRVKALDLLTPESVAKRYGRSPDDVVGIHYFDPARAIKVTMKQPVPAGSPGDTDVYGAQQHVPLMNMEVRDG